LPFGDRLQVGVSAGAPLYGALLGNRLFDGDPAKIDFGIDRAIRLRDNLSGAFLSDETEAVSSAAGNQRLRVQPYSPTLSQRLWYGAGSLHSAEWCGANGFHIMVGNLNRGEDSDSFFDTRRGHIDAFRAAWSRPGEPRIALGRVIVPIDSADARSRTFYAAFAEGRRARTFGPQGERRILYAKDLVGPSDQILADLLRDPILPLVAELYQSPLRQTHGGIERTR
jgi:alkanesulfonate monooxygenase SsuD/methylene tetrahydromethanopterin reductase-like flavin-dependent oxidoreductase (luciferase family)